MVAGALMPKRSRAPPTLNPNHRNCKSASAVTVFTYAMDVPPALADSITTRRASDSMRQSQQFEREGTRGYAHLVELHVPVARVWHALIDPRLMRIWSGKEAAVDARKNGLYRIGRLGSGGRG